MGVKQEASETTSAYPNKRVDVITKRKGGGTLIENRPVFSTDAKSVYLNCGWGVKVFSIKTGECVRVLDILSSNDRIAAVITQNNNPIAITSQGRLIEWNSSGTIVKKMDFSLGERTIAVDAYLIPNFKKRHKEDLCIQVEDFSRNCTLKFFHLVKGKELKCPLSNLRISKAALKHKISFGGFQFTPILGSISSSRLFVYSLDGVHKLKNGLKPGHGRKWTCVRCHLEETVVAAGDSTGRVVLFRNPLEPGGPTAVYHWHTLPCMDVAFTASGSSMYTGGGENVLVKWNVENPNMRYFLPRLSGEIVHISVAYDNQFVAVSTLDNSVQIVEASHRLKCVLQQLAWGVLPVANMRLFPAGLRFDPRTRSLVLNGRPGHLQFFCPDTEVLLFNVDITQQNYLTQERTKTIVNTEVTHSAISSDGAWMATVETRYEPGVSLEIRLKMWQYIPSKKCFSLSTSIDLPHNGQIETVQFRPGSNSVSSSDQVNLDYMLVTTGQDKKFRLWTPTEMDSIYKRGVVWGCESAGFFRDKDCGAASFSDDGSLLAVGFGPSLTIWDLDDIHLETTLTRNSETLRFVEFGRQEACHLVVTGTSVGLSIWNLLTITLVWHVKLKPSILVADPFSNYLAVFTDDNKMFVFTPLSTEPTYVSNNVCEGNAKVHSALFVPRESEMMGVPQWIQHSHLYYIDSNQELKIFEGEGESVEGVSHRITEDSEPGTLFSVLVNAQTTSEIQGGSKPVEHLHFGVLGAKAVNEFLKAPCHTMPPVSLLCNNLLRSLAFTKVIPGRKVDSDVSDSEGENKEDLKMSTGQKELRNDSSEISSGSEEEGSRKKSRSPKGKMKKTGKKDSFITPPIFWNESTLQSIPEKEVGSTKTKENVELMEVDFMEDIDIENFTYK